MDVLTDVLHAAQLGGTITATVTAAAPWGFQMHATPFAAFHTLTQGTCWLRRPGTPPLQLSVGDVTLLPSGAGHVLSSSPTGPAQPYDELVATLPDRHRHTIRLEGSGATTRIICGAYPYDRTIAHPLLARLPDVIHIPADQAERDTRIGETLRAITVEIADDAPGATMVVDRLVDVLFIQILRVWSRRRGDDGASWLLALRDPETAAALSAIHEHPDRPWTVESLARHVGLSRTTLARRFTALVGEPPLSYLTRWRLELAARQLRETDQAIPAIARRVGYTSEFAFSRAFRRARGLPPSRYRANTRA